MGFSRESKKPKNMSSRKKPETKNKVGKNISVSSWNNPDIKQYIGAREDTTLSTEHVRYTKLKKNENEQEKKKEKFSFLKRKTKTVEKNIEKISYIELDTGTIEIGYDKKTREVVLTFMYDTKREGVYAAKAKNENEKAKEDSDIEHRNFPEGKKVITIYGNISSGSDVKKSGTVTVRCNTNNILESIRKELYSGEKVSDKSHGSKPLRRDNLYLIEKILPFSDTNYEEEKRKEISKEKSESKIYRSNMHTAMTVLQNVEAAKKYKEMQLAKCMQNASKVAKEYKSGRTNISGYYMEILEKEKEKDKEKKEKEKQKEREKENQQEETIIPSGSAAAYAGAAAAIDSIATGIEEIIKPTEKKKTNIFDKFWKTDQGEDSKTDEEIIETGNENINNEEQEDERIDKENPDYEDLDEYEYEGSGNDDEDDDYEEDEDEEDEEDEDYDDEDGEHGNDEDDVDDEYEDDEEGEGNEFENDEEIEQEGSYESDEGSGDGNNEQEGFAINQVNNVDKNANKDIKNSKGRNTKKKTPDESKLPTDNNNDAHEDGDNGQEDLVIDQVDTVNKNTNKDREESKGKNTEKKALNESKLSIETNDEDSVMLEDENQNLTQDYEKINNDENK